VFVLDDMTGDGGTIAGGWTLNLWTIQPVNPVADLEVVMTGAPGSVLPGTPITYAFSVTNSGPNAASAVFLTDTLPAGVTIIGATSSQGTYRTNGTEFVFEFGSVPSGGRVTATLTVASTMDILNRVEVSGWFTDLEPDDNVAQSMTRVIAGAPTLSARISSGSLVLTGSGQPGVRYVIEATASWTSWSAVSTNVAGTDGRFQYVDSDTAQPVRFYRAVAQQQ
jgi:uncharacterized repeat protein (TIGR01451 family)